MQLFFRSILAKRCMCTHGRVLRYTTYELWMGHIKIAKVKPGEMPHVSDLKCLEGATQGRSLSLPVCLSTCIPFNTYFTCFVTFCLRGNSFLHSWRARALVTHHCSSDWNLVFSPPRLVWELKPCSSHCRLRPHEINIICGVWFSIVPFLCYGARWSSKRWDCIQPCFLTTSKMQEDPILANPQWTASSNFIAINCWNMGPSQVAEW